MIHPHEDLEGDIRRLIDDPSLRHTDWGRRRIDAVIEALDRGTLRVAERRGPLLDGDPRPAWHVHDWIQQAIGFYFPQRPQETLRAGIFEYRDKIPLKRNFAEAGVRVVPPATVRYGAFIEEGAVLMPSYVNIGAWVGGGTMVDTWATVGSCAQIGRQVHLSGGVGIGGVLEPPGARPVIVEDGAFIGSRCIVVEGVVIGREAVLGAGVVLTASTAILDMRGDEVSSWKGWIPPRAVVIPGVRPRPFPAGTAHVPCALIIGDRKASTDLKTSLNQALRDYDVAC